MKEHRYPRAVVGMDALRGALGAGACGALFAVAAPDGWLRVVMFVLLCAFICYLLQVAARGIARFESDELGLRYFRHGSSREASSALLWNELKRLDLDYFSTRRDGRAGWLQLRVQGSGGLLRLDSRLQGFERVLEHAVAAALREGVVLRATTLANLEALGYPDGFDAAPGSGAREGHSVHARELAQLSTTRVHGNSR